MAYQLILQIHLTVYRRQPDQEDHEVQSGRESEEEDDDDDEEEEEEEEEDDDEDDEDEEEEEDDSDHKDSHDKASASQGELLIKLNLLP